VRNEEVLLRVNEQRNILHEINWNQLSTSLLASFPCNVNPFRKKVKNVVTRKGIQGGVSVNK